MRFTGKQIDSLQQSMRERDTEDLLQIYAAHDAEEWSDEAFEAIRLVLLERGETPPQPKPSSTGGRAAATLTSPERKATWLWVWATAGGWIVGMTVVAASFQGFLSFRRAARLHMPIGVTMFEPAATIVGITGLALSVGIAQWLVLRARVSAAGWWVIATIAAIVVSELVSDAIGITVMWRAWVATWLSGDTPVAVSWVESWTRYLIPWAIQGVVIGIITGFTLEFLQRKPGQSGSARPS